MRSIKLCKLVFLLAGILLGTSGITIKAQEISKYDLEQRASHHFENSRYKKAAEDYELLHTMFPKDVRYSYFLGRSYLHSNINPEKAVELLKYAATRNYGNDAYFYLGLAYHYTYRFEEAGLAFVTFQKSASDRKQKKYNIDYWIAVTSNARKSVLIAQNLRIENLRTVPATSLESAFVDAYGGKFIYVPEELRSGWDREKNYNYLMFLPDDIENNDYLFYTSQSDKGKLGEDIYWVQRLNEKEYSVPEPLPDMVNTTYDDAYPFYDKSTGTLFFSSKGHNTSGGYDIFKVHFDKEKNEWGIPEKLNFPINSVRDDFMFSLSNDQRAVTFLTNRNSEPNEYEAYTIEYPFTGEFLSTQDRDEVVTFALLSPASITLDEETHIQSDLQPEIVLVINEERSFPDQETTNTDEYSQLINQALELQSQSDSLNLVVKQMRTNAQDEHDYRKKQELVASVTTLEQESKRMQRMADEKFALAEQLRSLDHSGLIAVKAENQDTEPEQSGITLYPYNTDAAVSSNDSDYSNSYNQGMEAAKQAIAEVNIGFNILAASPYSEKNPIPMASISEGLTYRIQLGAYSNEIPENTFGGLTPVSKEASASNTKYYVGAFNSIKEAREALGKVKEYGYPDAFLVSFFNSQKISVQKAREIEFAER